MKKVMFVFGTRPEAIKMAPLIHELQSDSYYEVKVCVTGQHREMLDSILELFKIKPDFDLNVMKHGQSFTEVTSKILIGLKSVLESYTPDIVLVHGDTNTTFSASLACFYAKIPVGHVEAGLRTGKIMSPWPEEANRKITSILSKIHFAPTEASKRNLTHEGIDDNDIFITGNTVIDALLWTTENILADPKVHDRMSNNFQMIEEDAKIILVTSHRRENFDGGFERLCRSLISVVKEHTEVIVIFPVHLNPNVQNPVKQLLEGIERIYLIEPQDYAEFIFLMQNSHIILTDSGGIQEEAPALGKPVLVLRETTERPEAIKAETAKLVGTQEAKIFEEISRLLKDAAYYSKMSTASNPYGDGTACKQISKHLKTSFFEDNIS